MKDNKVDLIYVADKLMRITEISDRRKMEKAIEEFKEECLRNIGVNLVRSYSKCLNCDGDIVKEKSQEILNNLDVIENRLSNVKELFRNSN